MGISSNQARFLALTSRQVDLEFRVQQICQRRLRLSSELENVATSYNNQISNRNLYAMNTSNSGISHLTVQNVTSMVDTNGKNYQLVVNTKDAVSTAVYNSIATSNKGGYISTTDSITQGSKTGCLAANGTAYTLADLGLKTGATEEAVVEAGLRAGIISIATQADDFTQTKTTVYQPVSGSLEMEQKDWRTLPSIADELYKGDDVTAENKYDKTIAEINAQDKKLQLEQTSIEVEYKAVTSEKESVKKILDTNATASFKYFS